VVSSPFWPGPEVPCVILHLHYHLCPISKCRKSPRGFQGSPAIGELQDGKSMNPMITVKEELVTWTVTWTTCNIYFFMPPKVFFFNS
jgi:hypothetical protein